VLRNDTFGHGQAESSASRVETRGHEGVEDIRQHIRRNARTVVFHGNGKSRLSSSVDAARANIHRTARNLDSIDCVAQQVHEHLHQAVGIADYALFRIDQVGEGDSRGARIDRHQRPGIVD